MIEIYLVVLSINLYAKGLRITDLLSLREGKVSIPSHGHCHWHPHPPSQTIGKSRQLQNERAVRNRHGGRVGLQLALRRLRYHPDLHCTALPTQCQDLEGHAGAGRVE